MSGYAVVETAIRGVVAALMLVAAVRKLWDRNSFEQTLTHLRVPRTPLVSMAVIVGEVMVGVSLLLGLSPYASAAVTAVLGVTFASIGLHALRLPVEITCSCFGSSSTKPLGMRQIAVLPLWIAASLILAAGDGATSTSTSILLMMVLGGLIGSEALQSRHLSDRLRDQRVSIDQTNHKLEGVRP